MPYPLLSETAQFILGEVQTSKRGQKFAPIQSAFPLWQLTNIDSPFYCPSGANVYKGDGTETRLNLDVRVDDRTKSIFEQLDKVFENRCTCAKVFIIQIYF